MTSVVSPAFRGSLPAGTATAEGEGLRRQAQRVLDQLGRKTDVAGTLVDQGAGRCEDPAPLIAVDPHAGARQNAQGALVQLLTFVLREDLQQGLHDATPRVVVGDTSRYVHHTSIVPRSRSRPDHRSGIL
jgi:hypothetical protein